MYYFINVELEDVETAWCFGEMEYLSLPRDTNDSIRHRLEHLVIRHFLTNIAAQGGVMYCSESPCDLGDGFCMPFTASSCKEGKAIHLYLLSDESFENAFVEMCESEDSRREVFILRKYAW